jgi:hypothetical protein
MVAAQSELRFDAPTEQQVNLERVTRSIGPFVEEFCRARFREGRAEFHMEELTDFVRGRAIIAPDSAGRCLRSLRKQRVVSYDLVSRSQSLYRITGVSNAQ